MTRVLVVAAVVLLAAPWSDAAISPRFRRLVAVGDSLFAGFGSGGLLGTGDVPQKFAAPKLVARQVQTKFPLPVMTRPGVPPPYAIDDANGNGVLDPGEVRRSSGIGFRKDTDKTVRNLAVPGESVMSVTQTLDAQEVAADAIGGNVSGRDALKVLILGLPLRSHEVSQLTQARDLHPTQILLWLGNNDYLGQVTDSDVQVPSAAEFGAAYRRVLSTLADTGATIAVANLPDATLIPALRHAAGEVTACRAADGSQQPVAPDDLLPVSLSRDQLPVPPCRRVLDAAKRARVQESIRAANAEIEAAATELEAARGKPVAFVDIAMLFDSFAREGYDVRGDGSLVLDAHFLGGLFSLDGEHPTRTAQAIIANAFISAMNDDYGEQVPLVDVARIAVRDPLVNNRFKPAGEPPFGLFRDEDAGEAVEKALQHIADDAQQFGGDIADAFSNLF